MKYYYEKPEKWIDAGEINISVLILTLFFRICKNRLVKFTVSIMRVVAMGENVMLL